MKRGATGLSGILLVDKSTGPSSHDVVNTVRRITGEKRVGHAGTLDPMASGLLVVLIGPATRLSDYLMGHDKTYHARIAFGLSTDTDDACGRPLHEAPVPDALCDEAFAGTVLASFLGEQMQVPPRYSALKREGVVSYKAARAGKDVTLDPRPCVVRAARLLGIGGEQGKSEGDEGTERVFWDVLFTVSKGTYIRALARDIGLSVGSAAHLSALRRLTSGSLSLGNALAETALHDERLAAQTPLPSDAISACFHDPVLALGLSGIELTQADHARVACGAPLDLSRRVTAPRLFAMQGATVLPLVYGDRLVALYRPEDGFERCVPLAVIPGGVGGVGNTVVGGAVFERGDAKG